MAASGATRFAGPGVVFALVALVLFSLMAITTDVALETMTWLQTYTIARGRQRRRSASSAVASSRRTAAAIGHRPVGWPGLVATAGSSARSCSAGTLDVVGLIAFAIGLETAPTWLVGLAASFGPAVTILVAVAFLGERLKPIQWVGLAGILVGMVAIAIP